MKVQATVLLSFQARTLAQAGELLDDVRQCLRRQAPSRAS
jgi:hypothetical protein